MDTLLDLLMSSAFAQEALGGPGIDPARTGLRLGAGGELIILALGALAFLALFKVYSLWPKIERWLVVASLVAFVPIASIVLAWVTNGRASISETLPFLAIIAAGLGGVWWLVKTKTGVLGESMTQPFIGVRETEPEVVKPTPRPASPPPAPSPPPRAAEPEPPRSTPSRGPKERIFLSYRRDDSADVTGRIYDRLTQHFGREQIFKDVDSIPLGVDFRDHLGDVVGRCNLVLVIIGDRWINAGGPGARRLDDAKDFVRIEIESALERKIPVVPVLVRGAAIPSDAELPASLLPLAYRNGIAVRSDPDFHRDMDRLIAGLEGHLSH